MYTQCPECLTAFRVTENLLQQASGRVRCGSCGHAFSALEHLSEEPPQLEGDSAGGAATEGGEDAFLDTFTDLSDLGDIKIEDTGVEWRVVDEDDEADASPPDDGNDGNHGNNDEGDTGASSRWFMTGEDELPPPIDEQVLPEVHDAVSSGDGGIQVEESRIRDAQASLELDPGADEPRYDDNTPLPEEFYQGAAESAEPEEPMRRASDQVEPRSPEFDERQSDLELGAPEDWRELLDEFGAAGDDGLPLHRDDAGPAEAAPPADDGEMPFDIDTQFDLQALELGIDTTGSHAVPVAGGGQAGSERGAEPDSLPEPAAHATAPPGPRPDDGSVDDETPGLRLEEDIAAETTDAGAAPRDAAELQTAAGPGAAGADAGLPGDRDLDRAVAEREELEERARNAAFEAELDAVYARNEAVSPGVDAGAETPPAPEEMTIDMQIDRDLMRLAAEQGFDTSSTGEQRKAHDSPLVETIVLEGDFVRTALDSELDAAVESAGAGGDDPRALLDSYVKSQERVRGGRRRTDPPGYALIGGVVALGVLLLAQVVHAYRESLATYAAFDQTVGSVYRMFGEPLVPRWDVSGWRFEATSGSTDSADEILTIRSRISNQSGDALPFPLLHVALTDRFEEVIGSRVLEPADYLAGGGADSGRVGAGEAFDATITVDAVSSEATGFKLNVCYREVAARLRCATEDFRE